MKTSHRTFAIAGLASLAACSSPLPDASKTAHSVNNPIVDDSADFWRADSMAEYLGDAQTLNWGVFDAALKSDSYLAASHPMTLRMQYWADQIDEMLRLRYPGVLNNIPSPKVAIYDTEDVNAYVTSSAVCYDNVSVRFGSAVGSAAPGVGITYYDGALEDVRDSFGRLNCKHVRATTAQIIHYVSHINNNDHQCNLALSIIGPEAFELRPNGCIVDPALKALGAVSTFVAMPTSQHVTLFSGILRTMSEDQMVSILAHELGHYYHGHTVAPANRYGFLFHQSRDNAPTEPLAAPDLAEQTRQIRANQDVLTSTGLDIAARKLATPLSIYPTIAGQRFHTALFLPLKKLVDSFNQCTGTDPDCPCEKADALARIKLSRFSSSDGPGITGLLLPAEITDYLAFEGAAVSCLAKARIVAKPLASTDPAFKATITEQDLFKNFTKFGYGTTARFFKDMPPVPGDLVKYVDELSAAVTAKIPGISADSLDTLGMVEADVAKSLAKSRTADDAIFAVNDTMTKNELGYYTQEEEADDLSAEWLSYLGFPTTIGGDADMNFVKAFDGAKAYKHCSEARAAGWLNADGSPIIEPWGYVYDPHPGDCFRVRNFDREAAAHHYPTPTVSPAAGLVPSWAVLVDGIGGQIVIPEPVDAGGAAAHGFSGKVPKFLAPCRFAPRRDDI